MDLFAYANIENLEDYARINPVEVKNDDLYDL